MRFLSASLPMPAYTLDVNGRTQRIDSADPAQPLLYVLRNALALHGPKFGCGLGQCGACTVLVDGRATRSCTLPVSEVGERKIVTIEGLGTPDKPHPVQAAFISEQAAQCGYCANGMVMTVAGLLSRKPDATLDEVKEALAGNLCRCGTHQRILRAALRAAEQMKSGKGATA